MSIEKPNLPLLEQRQIEARIVGPLVKAFAAEIGEERTLDIVAEVIRELARQSGAELARTLGDQTLELFARSLDRWRENGALEIDILEQSPERLDFNVTRCRYAEMYRALGLPELGASLSCQRDFALAKGFNPAIELVRTQTIMEGAPTATSGFGCQRRMHPNLTTRSSGRSRNRGRPPLLSTLRNLSRFDRRLVGIPRHDRPAADREPTGHPE